jgi:hypothetical protein
VLVHTRFFGQRRQRLANGLPQIRRLTTRGSARGFGALLLALSVCVGPYAEADETGTSAQPFAVQFGLGHESSTSPFLSLSDDGQFLTRNGNVRSAGVYQRGVLSGMGDMALGEALLGWSVHLDHKQFPASPALDFSAAMGHLTLGVPVGAGVTVGASLSQQNLRVAGALFRNTRTWSVNTSLGQPDGGIWVADLGFSKHRHPDTYTDMDARVVSASVHRRQPVSLWGVKALDINVGYDREHNERGLTDLSQRRVYARVSAEHKAGPRTWTLGWMVARTRFDDSALPGMAPRQDRLVSWDLGLAWYLGGGQTLALDLASATSRDNNGLFDNRYRNVMVSWSMAW